MRRQRARRRYWQTSNDPTIRWRSASLAEGVLRLRGHEPDDVPGQPAASGRATGRPVFDDLHNPLQRFVQSKVRNEEWDDALANPLISGEELARLLRFRTSMAKPQALQAK